MKTWCFQLSTLKQDENCFKISSKMDILFSAQLQFEPDLTTADNRFSSVPPPEVIIQSVFKLESMSEE